MQDPSAFTQLIGAPAAGLSFPEQERLKCPRCDSPNTKFCYYNNYNLSQPRHFCKSCRRYWTKGGALRNIPVGGGTRKPTAAKRSSSRRAALDPKPDPNPNPVPKSDPPVHSDQINGGSLSSLFGGYAGPAAGSGRGSGSELQGSGGLQNGWPDLAIYAASSSSNSAGSRFHSSVN